MTEVMFFGLDRENKSVKKYNFTTNTWIDMPDLIHEHAQGSSTVVLDNKVYLIAGSDDGGWDTKTEVEFIDLGEEKPEWKDGPKLNIERCNSDAVVVNGCIYVVGGWEMSHSREKFDPNQGKWSVISDLLHYRVCLACAVVNGIIYSIGGFCDDYQRKSMESFDPATNQQKLLASMKVNRRGHQAVVLDNMIYVIGGTTSLLAYEVEEDYEDDSIDDNDRGAELEVLCSVERYDPSTDTWCEVAPMSEKRADFCALVVNGEIMVFGGVGCKYMEVYHPTEDKWEKGIEMDKEYKDLNFVVL